MSSRKRDTRVGGCNSYAPFESANFDVRKIAFSSGNPAAVRCLYYLVCRFSHPYGVSYSTVKQQMEAEYGIPLDDVSVDGIHYTEDELFKGKRWQEENDSRQALVLRKRGVQ